MPIPASYSNAVVELFVEQAARSRRLGAEPLARHVALRVAPRPRRPRRGARLGHRRLRHAKGKVRIENDLAGEGATSRVTGAYFADGKQHLDYDTFQEHIAPNTTSDFAFKGALRDTARPSGAG